MTYAVAIVLEYQRLAETIFAKVKLLCSRSITMTLEFKVPDMACDACAKSITQAVLALDSQATVQADSQTKQVTVETSLSESSVRKAIANAGYNPT